MSDAADSGRWFSFWSRLYLPVTGWLLVVTGILVLFVGLADAFLPMLAGALLFMGFGAYRVALGRALEARRPRAWRGLYVNLALEGLFALAWQAWLLPPLLVWIVANVIYFRRRRPEAVPA